MIPSLKSPVPVTGQKTNRNRTTLELAVLPERGCAHWTEPPRRGAEFSLGPRAGYLWWHKNHPSSPWEVGGKTHPVTDQRH